MSGFLKSFFALPFLLIAFLNPIIFYGNEINSASGGFVKNMGQVSDANGDAHAEVLFTYEGNNARLFFEKNKIVYAFHTFEYIENEKSKEARANGDLEAARYLSMRIKIEHIELAFVNSNADCEVIFGQKQKYFQNFYLGNCPQGITNVPVFSEVTYKNVYQNIDLHFVSGPQGMKYDIILRPGARLSDIQFRYDGVESISANGNRLKVNHRLDSFEEVIPRSYFPETEKDIKVLFKITNQNTFGFQCESMNNDIITQTLIIDPTLTWSTYIERTTAGAVGGIRGNSEVDANGNLFYQVNTYYADLPIGNPGGVVYLDPSYNPSGGGLDIYFAMFNADRELFWSTYLGGTNSQSSYYDHGLAIYQNTLYITGSTNSNNFPILNQGSGAYYVTYPGSGQLGFLSKFNTTNGQMIHSTYLNCYGYTNMDVDNNGNVAVIAFCYDFAALPNVVNRAGAYNSATFTGTESEMFIYMFNASMVQTWGTYFGGVGYSDPMGLAFDGNNNLFAFTRSSSSTAMPLMNPGSGAYYDATVQDKYDLGISKFNTSGVLVWSTYLGGSGLEGLSYSNISINSSNEVIITSQTSSTDIYVLNQGSGAYYQGTPPAGLANGWGGTGSSAGYFAKFSNSGVLQHATYIGMGNEENYIQDNNVGYCDKQYMILSSKTFPTTPLAGSYNVSNANPANYNYLILELNADLSMNWASYLQPDSAFFERCPTDLINGRLYVSGTVNKKHMNTAYPGVPAFIDTILNYATNYAYALMEFNIGGAPLITVSGGGSSTICFGDDITLTASGSGTLNWYDAASGGTLIGTGPSLTLNNLTSDTTIYVEAVQGSCTSPRIAFTITVTAPIDAAINPAGPYCITEAAVNLTAINPGGTWAGIGITNAGLGTFDPATAGLGTHEITYTTAGGCNDTDTIQIMVVSQMDATITAAGPFCDNDSIIVLSTAMSGGTWSGAGIVNPTNGTFNPANAGTGSTQIIYTIAGACGDDDTIQITIYPAQILSSIGTPESCITGLDASIDLSVSGGNSPYSYLWSNAANTQDLAGIGDGTYSVLVTDANGCQERETVVITESTVVCDDIIPHAVVPDIFSPNGDGQNDVLYVRGEGISQLSFVIYDRWGEKIFESSDPNTGWDGTFRGKPLDAAVFVYYLRVIFVNAEELIQEGNVTLVR